jgi:hypothetical protein
MKNTKVTPLAWAKLFAAAFSLMASLLMGACGGGGLTAGVGTGGTGLAEGTVTGFGSVIVDGTEYDDASANIQQDDGTGVAVNADLKLGQRVQLSLNADKTVKSVAVMPQLVGLASTAQDANGNFRVLGQWVRLAGSNADTSQSPAVVLAGLGNAAIDVGDPLEVHGTWVFDSQLASYVLIASRVEKLAAAPALLQLSGVVQTMSGKVMRLNSVQGPLVQADVLPAGLAVGHLVRIWATQAAWSASTTTPSLTLVASRIADSTLTADLVADQTAVLSGPVANYNAALRTVELQGTTVQLGPQLLINEQDLLRGAFVSLSVQRSGANLVAQSASQRGNAGTATDLGQSIAVKAITNGIDWSADPVQFSLRGVPVSAAATTLSGTCRQATNGVDLLVDVIGRVSKTSNVVVASQVNCSLPGGSGNNFPPGTITVRTGLVTQINLMMHTLVLQTLQGNVTVQWDPQTFFAPEFNMRPESLTGQSVEVEGVNQTGLLRARTVRRSP